MNRLNLHKSSNCTKAEKIVPFENRSQQQQHIFSIYQSPEPLVKFLANACLQSEVSAQHSRKWLTFLFRKKRCTPTKKTLDSPYDPTKLAIHSILQPQADLKSICGHIFKKTVSFDDIVHFIDNKNIVIYVDFDSGIVLYPEARIKVGQINREQKFFSRSCEEPKCVPTDDQPNSPIDEEHASIIFLNPWNLWNKEPAGFKSLNYTNDSDSMSNPYPGIINNRSRTDL